jgi:hypothetical protein
MEFRVHSAVMLTVTAAGPITAVAQGSSARYDGALEKTDDSYPAWRDTSKTWGDARLLTSICLATK